MTNVLYVANEAQKILFDSELSGQISDGHWENASPHDHWQIWCDADVVVAPANTGRTFYARKSNYNFTASQLLEVVADRMIDAVVQGTGNRAYGMQDLKRDLTELKAIVRRQVTPLPSDVAKQQAKERAAAIARAARQAAQEVLAAEINATAKELGISLYASPYETRVALPQELVLELLQLKREDNERPGVVRG